MTDKVSPGSKFRGSPLTSAATVNGILDAAEDYTKRRQLGRGVDPIRKTLPTDLVRVRNDSGSDRRAGEVMRVGNAIIDEDQLTNEFLWFEGLAPNTSEKFGILRKPLPEDKIGELQVSGVCKAWVNITDISHERAKVTPDSYVLTSADTGQFKLLWTPGETGEQDCVVVFADKSKAASCQFTLNDSLTTSTESVSANVERVWGDTTVAVDDTITVYNHDTATASEYMFEGVSGAWGTALWDSADERWRIIQLECP